MMGKTNRILVNCLDCEAEITLTGQVGIGQPLICRKCGTMMEVVELDPVEVDWIYDEPEYVEEEDC